MPGDSQNALSVLVVDDDPVSRKIMVGDLRAIGVETVLEAGDGVRALDLLKSRQPDVDLIISDVEMPEMGGYELARRIRFGSVPKFKDVPIIMVTGHNCEEYERRARVYRLNGYVVKSPNTEIFRLRIMEALGLAQVEARRASG